MNTNQWPDPLQRPDAPRVAQLLNTFWQLLDQLPDLLNRREHLLAEHLTSKLRGTVLEMMLALNGIQWPANTRHLNSYLSAQQRAAIEKTLVLPEASVDAWIGRGVGLLVIYRWYAPQLVEAFNVPYPQELESTVWAKLQRELPDWPVSVTTD